MPAKAGCFNKANGLSISNNPPLDRLAWSQVSRDNVTLLFGSAEYCSFLCPERSLAQGVLIKKHG